jgi:serine/threonine-protein kinase
MAELQRTAATPCPDDPTLARYVDDQLPPEEDAAVAGHVERCPRCQSRMGRLLGSLPDGLQKLLPLPPAVAAAESEGDPPPRLDGYEVLGRVGAGGMGVVWRVRDLNLGRDVALKVMKARLCGQAAEYRRRFLDEAHLCASLTHPSIVPVHRLEQLDDGRPYYLMKLVVGQTLAEHLKGRATPAERLTELVQVFAQVCQAVGHAHGKGIIHRDLKPANVMVGEHGEVQVMDWGLAKALSGAQGPEAERAPADGAPGDTLHQRGDRTAPDQVMGTWPYLPPEQAVGQVGEVDARSDVFALGAILCEVLTGLPPYAHFTQAAKADLAGALGRLRGCGADADLVRLAERCLAPVKADRPADAGEVAAAVLAYQGAAQERLRRAELERTAAQARAEEAQVTAATERKARRRTAALAAVVLAALVASGAGAVWLFEKRAEADRAVDGAVAEATNRLSQAERAGSAAKQLELCREAEEAARRAVKLAEGGFTTAAARGRAAAALDEAEQARAAAERDRDLLARLPAVRIPRDSGRSFRFRGHDHALDNVTDSGSESFRGEVTEDPETRARVKPAAVSEPETSEVDRLFADAFRRWGLDVDGTPLDRATAVIAARPAWVRAAAVAALDEWASERRTTGRPKADWKRLSDLADRVDGDEQRRSLRSLLAGDRPRQEWGLESLAQGLMLAPAVSSGCWLLPARAEPPPGSARLELRELARRAGAAEAPVLGVLLLARTLQEAGDEAEAEVLLRSALRVRPGEPAYWHALGRLLQGQWPQREPEALACFETLVALRPELGMFLASALEGSGRREEARVIYQRLCKEHPENHRHFIRLLSYLSVASPAEEMEAACREAVRHHPGDAFFHCELGDALSRQEKHREAAAAYREAVRLAPDFAPFRRELAATLSRVGRYQEAEAEFRQVIASRPHPIDGYFDLAGVLSEQGRYKEAEAPLREALRRHPRNVVAFFELACVLQQQGRDKEAEEAFGKVIQLKPNFAMGHLALGNVLWQQRKLEEAEAAYRRAIGLYRDFAEAHCNLGQVLLVQGRFDEALKELRRGHALGSQRGADWPYPSDWWVKRAELMSEWDRKLPAVLEGSLKPAPAERLVAAELCQFRHGRYAAAARLYAEAFAGDPKLADDLRRRHRYNAACAAALAASGQGKDADRIDPEGRAGLRLQALGWLQSDFERLSLEANSDDPRVRLRVRGTLGRWMSDPDLAGLRDPEAIARLPEPERDAWQRLWAEVRRQVMLAQDRN